ncbi:MAG: dihydroneopterin aldolase [Verrucomicrobiota bacterium]
MDKIIISDLEVQAHIGTTAAEREHPQRLLVSIVMERDLNEAGRTDMESSTTGYDAVIDLVKKLLAHRPRKLIEAVASEIAELILSRRLAVAVTVEVKKFSMPGTRHVAVEIRRTQ